LTERSFQRPGGADAKKIRNHSRAATPGRSRVVEEDVRPGSALHLNMAKTATLREAGENATEDTIIRATYFSQRVELAFVAV